MPLYADDPDVNVVYPITAVQGSLDFAPVVRIDGYPDITAEWEDPADTDGPRDLRVPLYGLPAYRNLVLRLVVPGDNDIELGRIVLESRGNDPVTQPPWADAFRAEMIAIRDSIGGGGGGSDSLTVVNGGTVTLDDTRAEGSLVGYRVKASAEFTATAGSATLEPGAYTFERTADGWDYYPISAGTSLTTAPPAPGWTAIATDTFAATDGSPLVGRTTTTGGLVWASQSNGGDVLIQGNRAVFATGGYGRSLRLPLLADHAAGLRVTLNYELVGGVGGVSICAGVTFTPHVSGVTIDGGNLYPGGSVAATSLTGTTTGLPTTGTLQVEFTPTRNIVVRVNGTQVAAAQLGEDLKGQVVQINWEAATTALDNLVIEAVA